MPHSVVPIRLTQGTRQIRTPAEQSEQPVWGTDEYPENYKKLLEKKEIIVLTKTDLIDNFDIKEAKKKFKDIHSNIYAISLYDDDDMKSFGEALIKEFTLINE